MMTSPFVDLFDESKIPVFSKDAIGLFLQLKPDYPTVILFVRECDYYFTIGRDAIAVYMLLDIPLVIQDTHKICAAPNEFTEPVCEALNRIGYSTVLCQLEALY